MITASFTDRHVAFEFAHAMLSKELDKYGIDVVIRPHEICITEDAPTECPF